MALCKIVLVEVDDFSTNTIFNEKLKKLRVRMIVLTVLVLIVGALWAFSTMIYKGEHNCRTPHVTEEEIKAWFLSAINQLLSNRDEIIANTERLIDMAKNTSPLEDRIDDLEQQLETIRQDIVDLVDRNARRAQNQELYQKQYDTLLIAYQEKQKELHETNSTLEDQKSKSIRLDRFIQQLKEQDDLITAFNQELWQTSVERLDIKEGKTISLTFKNGVQIDL